MISLLSHLSTTTISTILALRFLLDTFFQVNEASKCQKEDTTAIDVRTPSKPVKNKNLLEFI